MLLLIINIDDDYGLLIELVSNKYFSLDSDFSVLLLPLSPLLIIMYYYLFVLYSSLIYLYLSFNNSKLFLELLDSLWWLVYLFTEMNFYLFFSELLNDLSSYLTGNMKLTASFAID